MSQAPFFKVYDPVAKLIAESGTGSGGGGGGGGGGGLPSTGGTLTGNLNIQQPSKIIQCQPPSTNCDVVNKKYVDDLVAGVANSGGGLPVTGGTLTGNLTIQQPSKIVQCQPPSTNCDVVNKKYVDDLVATAAGSFLPLTGGALTGQVTQNDPPTANGHLANKGYVDSTVTDLVPPATASVMGKIQLAGDLVGSATEPRIGPGKIDNSKLLAGSAFTLKGTNATSAVTDFGLGSTLKITGSTLNVDAAALSGALSGTILPLTGGTLTGPIFYSGTPNTGSELVNKTYVDSKIVDATVISKGVIQLTGDLTGTATDPRVGPGKIDNAKMAPGTTGSSVKGTVAGLVADVTLGTNLTMNGGVLNVEVANLTNNLSSTLLSLNGGTVTGKIVQPAAPTSDADLANKAYVDSRTKDATTTAKGVIQLAGDLTGSATEPRVGPGKIDNTKLLAGDRSTLKGTDGLGMVSDLILGSNFSMAGKTVNVNVDALTTTLSGTLLPLSGGSMTGPIFYSTAPTVGSELVNKTYVDSRTKDATTTAKGVVQLAGDLTGTATDPRVGPGKIDNSKLVAGTVSPSIKGTVSGAVADVSLGNNLTVNGGVLNVNVTNLTTTLSSTLLPLTGGTVAGPIAQPLAPVADVDLANKAYVDSKIKDATTTAKGVVQLAGDLTGTATDPRVGLGKIDNTKMAPGLVSPSIKGTVAGAVADVSIGTNLTMTGGVLNVNVANLTTNLSSTLLPLTGGTVAGPIAQPLAPVADADLANKAYVDSRTKDATTTAKGVVQLAGDLTGTASGPLIGDGKVINSKLAPGATFSSVKGTNPVGTVVDVTLGSGLSMSGAGVLSVNTASSTLDATTTSKGIVQLAGDLEGFAAAPLIKPMAVSNTKLADFSNTSQLKGSSSTSKTATDITLGSGLSMANTVLSVDATTLPIVPVSKGGTGASSLTGYLKGNGTAPISSVTSIPGADVQGAVLSVNGVFPTTNGNVVSILGTVSTGTLLNRPSNPGPNGLIYVVSNDPGNDGETFISDGTDWREVTSNMASTDARYVLKAGSVLTGNLTFPTGTKITIADGPTAAVDAVNKSYVDSLVQSSTPDATVSVKGKIQLAGDLTGSSSNPEIGPSKITNPKILAGNASTLKGTAVAGTVSDVEIGPNLEMVSGTLNVKISNLVNNLSATLLPLSGGTLTGPVNQPALPVSANELANKAYVDSKIGDATPTVKGVIQLTGDLTGSAVNPVIGDARIVNRKLAPGGNLSVKGTTSGGTVTDFNIGTGLVVSNAGVLTVDNAAVVVADATATVKGIIQLAGDLTGSIASNPVIADGKIVNKKLAPGAGLSVKGTTTAGIVTDLSLGAGLTVNNAGFMVVDTATVVIADATAATKGVILLGGDLTGSATGPLIGDAKIVNKKLAPATTGPAVKGTTFAGIVEDFKLGTGLSIDNTGSLVVDTAAPTLNATLTTKGIIQLAGDLSGTATEPRVGPGKIDNLKLVPGGGPSIKATNLGGSIIDATLGPSLSMSNSGVLSINPVAIVTADATNASKGIVQLSGDLSGSAAAPVIGDGKIGNAKLVAGGNSSVKGTNALGKVSDFTLGNGLEIDASGLLVVNSAAVASPDATPAVKGLIALAGDLGGTAADPRIGDGKVVNSKLLAGPKPSIKGTNNAGTVVDLSLGPGFTINAATNNLTLDAPVIPDATTTSKGIVSLAGDLTGTAADPRIGDGKIGNAKLVAGSPVSVKGTNLAGKIVDVKLGSGLALDAATDTLSVNVPGVADATTTTKGVIQLAGDLVGPATAPLIGPNKIVNSKLAPGGASTIKSTNPSGVIGDYPLGLGLTMNPAGSISVADATTTAKGVIQLAGDLAGSAAAPVVGFGKINNSKLVAGANSSVKGTDAAGKVADFTLGSGLTMTGTVLSSSGVDATSTVKGVVQLAGDLSGSAALPVVGPGKINNSKIAPMQAVSSVKGSSSASTAVTDITLGSSMQMNGTVMSSKVSFFNGTNPATTAPPDRPATTGVLYYGNDGSTWVYNGTNYVTQIGNLPFVQAVVPYPASGTTNEVKLENIHVRFSTPDFQILCSTGVVSTYERFQNSRNNMGNSGGQFAGMHDYTNWLRIPGPGNFRQLTYPGYQLINMHEIATSRMYEVLSRGPSTSDPTCQITIKRLSS